nr:hypothetical protein [Candidatus Njordarchaeum guaymaensis]
MIKADKILPPSIGVKRFGNIERELLEWVTSTFCEFYGRVRLPCSQVELLLFEDRLDLEAYLKREGERFAKKHGFEYAPITLGFSSMHHAWSGQPTIVVCGKTMKERDKGVVLGELRHEAGHSVLHGSPEFYLIRAPKVLEKLIIKKSLDRRVASIAFYFFSIGVKDFEVTRLLVENGYIDCQKALHAWSLRITDDEKRASRLAEHDYNVALFLMANTLKPVMGSVPLLSTDAKSELLPLVEDNLSLLPLGFQVLAKKIVEEWIPRFGGETLYNIRRLVENIVLHETSRV